MKKLPLIFSACLLAVILTLSSCAVLPTSSDPASGGLSAEQAQAGLEWLDASLARLSADVAVAKAIAPEKADAIDAAVGGYLAELRMGLATIREQLAAGRTGAADTVWQTMRPLVGQAALRLLTYGVGAVAGS
ncbi:hypothetical protein G3N56_06115 [Desulfovibrio sulfodismutans]|uniref:Uncharacterized protein n=1 Tax=Desulfolutivibrio sulfodismutans TaxID=63561 RepID=A0A7K3NJM8_9BACT|nr:hypothetical protein [Desulfolutivibrio sulfodismutans]NDY56317.1 hypothetical protein [Desulfolutivibrio sulfodismutans]QLA11502.1 hypothetical protein GD606_04035 [Desulfolutivibrio sulfodismutans DSM 3696]QLA14198.1 hypothetical protein GD606_18960 [Desulfolutivibrio sulfodismutans DSM 3696]